MVLVPRAQAGRLRAVGQGLRAPAFSRPVQSSADGAETTPIRLLFLGVDHPHGCSWRESLETCGRFQIVGFVPGFGGAITSLEERYMHLPRFDVPSQAIFALNFDAAVCLMSNREGASACLELSKAGKHCMMEKPGIGSPEAGQEILDAVRAAGTVFTMAYTNRYGDAATKLAAMVKNKQFGKLIALENTSVTTDIRLRNPAHYLFNPTENAMSEGEGGYFSWLGCHNLDMVMYLTGQRVVGVTAVVGKFGAHQAPVEDGGTVILELSEGTLVTVSSVAHCQPIRQLQPYSYLLLTRVCWPQLTGGYYIPSRRGETSWSVRGSERWVHWRGDSLEIHGTNPQWEHLAVDEVYDVDPRATPV